MIHVELFLFTAFPNIEPAMLVPILYTNRPIATRVIIQISLYFNRLFKLNGFKEKDQRPDGLGNVGY